MLFQIRRAAKAISRLATERPTPRVERSAEKQPLSRTSSATGPRVHHAPASAAAVATGGATSSEHDGVAKEGGRLSPLSNSSRSPGLSPGNSGGVSPTGVSPRPPVRGILKQQSEQQACDLPA